MKAIVRIGYGFIEVRNAIQDQNGQSDRPGFPYRSRRLAEVLA